MFKKMIAAWNKFFGVNQEIQTTAICGAYMGLKLIGFDYPEEDNSSEYEAELIAMQRKSKQRKSIEQFTSQVEVTSRVLIPENKGFTTYDYWDCCYEALKLSPLGLRVACRFIK